VGHKSCTKIILLASCSRELKSHLEWGCSGQQSLGACRPWELWSQQQKFCRMGDSAVSDTVSSVRPLRSFRIHLEQKRWQRPPPLHCLKTLCLMVILDVLTCILISSKTIILIVELNIPICRLSYLSAEPGQSQPNNHVPLMLILAVYQSSCWHIATRHAEVKLFGQFNWWLCTLFRLVASAK
jgi:hypothetical protein